MRKVFGIATLLLTLAACNKVETGIQTENPEVEPVEKAEGISITATLAPKTSPTKAVADNGDNKITATWAQNEKIAIIYEVSSTKYVAEANIDAVDGETGAATISFTVESGTADDTPCTLVYPAKLSDGTTTVYKDDLSGVKDAAALLAAQDGTLNANLDIRVGEGAIQTTTPSLDVTTQPAPQFAIFKFTVKNADASATIDVKPLTVTIDAQDYVITPASATSELYAALPAISSKAVSFTAEGSDSKNYTADYPSISFSAGYFYQSTLKMAEAAAGNTVDLSTLTANYEAQDGDVLTGTLSGNYKITIADGATVTLKDVTITNLGTGCDWAGINCPGDATIVLKGENTVCAGRDGGNYNNYPGIWIAQGKTLTIKGDGSLTAYSNETYPYGAGIGGGYQIACGNITIEGGNITATGGSGAASIGGGQNGSCGDISIEGGTITATGGFYAAGIGSGYEGSCGNITITDGVTKVTATKGEDAPNSIGKGYDGSCGTVTIGGTVTGSISQSPYTYQP